mmetsp:Transcript_12426/g.30466  ORF Transcript_12426/g.30466 Transcript_12426/m.30466 type:complete len:110 (-) Transcript_12426:35-364(-)
MGWWPDILNPLKLFKGGAMSPQAFERQRQMMQLVGETEAMGDMLTRMNRQCYDFCNAQTVVEGRTRGEDLTLDEQACVDCCAAKFLEAQMKVGAVFMEQAQETGQPVQM